MIVLSNGTILPVEFPRYSECAALVRQACENAIASCVTLANRCLRNRQPCSPAQLAALRRRAERVFSSGAEESVDRFRQLSHLVGRVSRFNGLGHAVLRVVVEQEKAHLLEGGSCRIDLGQDVDAVPVLDDHPLDAPHLALYPLQATGEGWLALGIPNHGPKVDLRRIPL
jgi:hypothetical protein